MIDRIMMPKGPQGQTRPADCVGAAVKVARIATGALQDDVKLTIFSTYLLD